MDLFTSLGLEYSAGEGTNYPPKFDSAPGKPVFTSFSLVFFFSLELSLLIVIVFNCFSLTLGAWRTPTEEWGTEDWNEDVSVSELNM